MNWASIKQRAAERLFGEEIRRREAEAMAAAEYCQQAAAEVRVQQAVMQIRQALPSLATWEPSMAGFRRFTGQHDLQSTLRDLAPLDQERQAHIGHYLFATNPMAKWLVKIGVAYQLGGGVTLAADDDEVQALLDAFWRDPVNQWDVKLPRKLQDLGIFGEQCWPRFVAPGTGRVRLGYLDPTLIGQVVLDPDNAEQPIGIITRTWTNVVNVPERRYRVILGIDEDELTPLAQQIRRDFTDGDCFYFAINHVSNGSRGISDLYDKADWLDGYEQFMFNRLERADLANRIVTDVTMTGATQSEVDTYRDSFKLPPPGGAHIHNDKVAIDMKAPKLEAADASIDARLFRHQCLAGFPEHWMGGGGDVNRATASEMDEPTFKLLEMAQHYTQHMIVTVCTDQIRQAKRVGALRQSASETFTVQLPEMVKADMGKLAETFDKVSRTATTNVREALMTKEEARRLIAITAKPLGVELAPMDQQALEALEEAQRERFESQDYREAGEAGNEQPGKVVDLDREKGQRRGRG